jgi:hypothetical protein
MQFRDPEEELSTLRASVANSDGHPATKPPEKPSGILNALLGRT